MHVNDVVAAFAQNSPDIAAQIPAERNACLRSVRVDGLAPADADDVRLLLSARNVRCDDVDMVPATPRFSREKMNVLANPAQMRVVVLRHQRDAERSRVAGERKGRELRKSRMATASASCL